MLVGDGRGPRCELDRKCAPGEGKPGEGAVEDAFLLAAGLAHTRTGHPCPVRCESPHRPSHPLPSTT